MNGESKDSILQVQGTAEEQIAARLAEIDVREQAAEKGPWKHDHGYIVFDWPGEPADFSMVAQVRGWGRLTDNPGHMPPEAAAAQQDANGAFLAHSRADIPWFRALVRELQACNARQEQLLKDAQAGWAADVARLASALEEAEKEKETIRSMWRACLDRLCYNCFNGNKSASAKQADSCETCPWCGPDNTKGGPTDAGK
jgi:hypothetical protein